MATMNINTANSTFRQLLANVLTYRVPPYQRDYSWTQDEWADLWQDIVAGFDGEDEPSHYMGYLVLQSSDNKQFDIIDGQQRITTLSLIILAALDHLQSLVDAGLDADNNAKRQEQLRNSYIGFLDPVSLVPQSKLELNRHNNSYYQNYLVSEQKPRQPGLKLSERQLGSAFRWFRNSIKDRFAMSETCGSELASFIDKLVDRIFFTVITVTDELNAFKVFETLNARGVRLSATDLLKNYLFSVISTRDVHASELKNLEDRWERIVDLLGSEKFPEFIRAHWNSRNSLVRSSDLFKTIRQQVGGHGEAHALVRELDLSAGVYAALRDSGNELWNKDEKHSLEHLSMFNVRQPLAMLLACHKSLYEKKRGDFTRIVRAVLVLSFRYNVICNQPTNIQEILYNKIACKIFDGTYTGAPEVLAALEEIYPKDNQFKAAFEEKELRTTNNRNKKVVRYILSQIERQASGQDFDSDSATYSLEHILPEKPSENWSSIEEAKQERLLYRLGNMTLLETILNRDLGNKCYCEKRAAYEDSDIKTTKGIAKHYDSWDGSAIDRRQQWMAKLASSIWKIEF